MGKQDRPMNQRFLAIIRRIISEQGEAVLDDPARLKGFIADYAKNESKVERIAFGRCIEYGAYTELKAAEDREAVKAAIARRVNANEGIEMALCNDALDALEAALFGEAKPKKALCLKCGRELEPGWKACPFCGAGSAAQAAVPQSATPPGSMQAAVAQSAVPADPAQAGAKEHTGRNVALAMMVAAVMIAAVIAGGIYLSTKLADNSSGKLADNSSGGAGGIYVSGSDVYVVGYEGLDERRATYWKNGQSIQLSNSYSEASSIYVSGSDVYVAGRVDRSYESQTPTAELPDKSYESLPPIDLPLTPAAEQPVGRSYESQRATYWKNGRSIQLSNSYSEASSIYASGSDVYVAGYEWVGGSYESQRATYWKNGRSIQLSNSYSEASSIYVSDSDVYVAGYEWVGGSYESQRANDQPVRLSNSFSTPDLDAIYVGENEAPAEQEPAVEESQRATYWKNGQAVRLSNSFSEARSIYVSGSDVYVAGFEEVVDDERATCSTYWKNGQAVRLSNSFSEADSIYVSGSDVYVAGHELVDGNLIATYWKNGQPVRLSNRFSEADSIYVSGSDVYVAGEEYERVDVNGIFTDSRTTYWKNGQKINLGKD